MKNANIFFRPQDRKGKFPLAVLLFFFIYFIAGLSVFRDYGISWDENGHRYLGIITGNYILNGDTTLFAEKDVNDHGSVFDLALVGAEFLLQPQSSRNIFMLRHGLSFLVFFFSTIVFYLLIFNRYKSWKLALLGTAMLVMSPRFFAESFYNGSDIPSLCAAIICLYFLVRYQENKSYADLFLLSLCGALFIDIRIAGLIVPALALAFIIFDLIFLPAKKRLLLQVFFLILVTGALVVLFWPYLWPDPVKMFAEVFRRMSAYDFEALTLFMGKFYHANELPWYYLPVWILVTIPVWYSFFMVTGFISIIISGLKRFKDLKDPHASLRKDVVFTAIGFGTLTLVILMGVSFYDGWRHMYFLYPAFLMVALKGINLLYRLILNFQPAFRYVFTGLLLLLISFQFFYIIHWHPYQNVYFNTLAGNPDGKFEKDYWGLSYRAGLEYILKNDSRSTISIEVNKPPGLFNRWILPDADQKRIKFTGIEEADYFITEFRLQRIHVPEGKEVYAVSVDGLKIMAVYKLK
ncbi:MAG: ArnT family glycosyltransferase [Cytophagaceae bacterium]